MSMDLSGTFRDAYEFFNSQNWPQLELLLDYDVTMKKLDDKVKPQHHDGKAEVVGYFLGHGADDRAKFTPDEPPYYKEIGNIGLVAGSAKWQDKSSSPNTVPIAYAFAFTRDAKGNWLALHLWGSYTNCTK